MANLLPRKGTGDVPARRTWRRFVPAVVAAAAVAVLPSIAAAQFGAVDGSSRAAAGAQTAVDGALGASETGRWVVQLDEPSLATYEGGTAGLKATSPEATGATKLEATSAAARAYTDHLETRQDAFLDLASQGLGREVTVEAQLTSVLNAVVIEADQAEASRLAGMPGVEAVYPDRFRELTTDVSHDYIGSPAIWEGATAAEIGTRGEGVLVGILDSGVNPEHPSFAATDGEGYEHQNPLGQGTYLGVCDPTNTRQPDEPICNDKLVGAWAFDYRSASAIDTDGHGSHTASTAAGNVHEATFTVGGTSFTRELSGVAPRANLITYRVCVTNCPITAILAGIDQAITDGVDVINFSIAGSDDPWADPVSRGFLEAMNAGVFVAAAAGNEGPGPSTAAHTGPWVTAVAASTTHRAFAQTLDVVTSGAPEQLAGVAATPSGDGPALTETLEAEIRDAAAVSEGNGLACSTFPSGVFDGAIALVERGACNFSDKVDNAAAAGAEAVVVFSDSAGPPTTMGGLLTTDVPAVMIGRTDGLALRDFMAAQRTTVVRLNHETSLVTDDEWANVVAGFSSRGPSRYDLLVPTLTAPGVNILAANAGDADSYMVQQGTSMASPHVAGAGALMTALHPDWSPAQIRSALAGTADPTVLTTGSGPAGVFDQGSGLLDLASAGRVGLVLDESYENFKAANPAAGVGGDPHTLNVPSLVDQTCGSSCTWTRTLTNVADTTATYTATDGGGDVAVSADPASVTLAPGESASVELTARPKGQSAGEWVTGAVTWSTDGTHAGGAAVADLRLPVVVKSSEASITVRPTQIEASQQVGTSTQHTLTIGNTGGQDLEWNLVEESTTDPKILHPVEGTPITAQALPRGRTLADDEARLRPLRNPGTLTTGTSSEISLPQAEEGTTTMTHSLSQEIVANNTVACSTEDGLTGDNGYLRTFTLKDFGITSEFEVTDVSFGVEAVNAAPAPVTVRLYTLDAQPLTYANMTEIGSKAVTLLPQALQMTTVPVAGTVPAGATLVVELDAPDTSGVSGFFAGSNAAGETAPSYLRSVGCGMPEPAPMAALGFPQTQLVMNVTGRTDLPAPGVPSWLSMRPTSGTVPGGGSQEATVTIDSTGMEAGDTHSALIELASNDPGRPTTRVPVTLTVTGDDGSEPPSGGEADQEIVATVSSGGGDGSLVITVDPDDRTVALPEMAGAGDRFTTSGELRPVTVTDSRRSDPGWNVSAQVSDFAARSGDATFGGGYLGWVPLVQSVSDGQAVTPGGETEPGFPSGEGLSEPRQLAEAAPGAGRGSAVLGAELELEIPLQTKPGVYTAVLTLTAL